MQPMQTFKLIYLVTPVFIVILSLTGHGCKGRGDSRLTELSADSVNYWSDDDWVYRSPCNREQVAQATCQQERALLPRKAIDQIERLLTEINHDIAVFDGLSRGMNPEDTAAFAALSAKLKERKRLVNDHQLEILANLKNPNTTHRIAEPADITFLNKIFDGQAYIAANNIRTSGNFTCALLSNRGLRCWGENSRGQLGTGDREDRGRRTFNSSNTWVNELRDIPLGGPTLDFVTTNSNVCTWQVSGEVKCWGDIQSPVLGFQVAPQMLNANQTLIISNLPPLFANTPIRQLVAGSNHACVVFVEGPMRCWGQNTMGQLGIDSLKTKSITSGERNPGLADNVKLMHTKGFQAFASSENTCIKSNSERGNVLCWGSNGMGNLGIADRTNRGGGETPSAMMSNLSPIGLHEHILDIVHSGTHTCARLEGNQARCWGRNTSGELGFDDQRPVNTGDPNSIPLSEAPKVKLKPPIEALAVTHPATCALTSQHAIYCWGSNEYGHLGRSNLKLKVGAGGTSTPMAEITPLPLNGPATAIALGTYHGCALLKSGLIQCWGNNALGQAGINSNAERVAFDDSTRPLSYVNLKWHQFRE